MNDAHHLIETDPLECVPETLTRRIEELEALTTRSGTPYTPELEALRLELKRRLHEARPE